MNLIKIINKINLKLGGIFMSKENYLCPHCHANLNPNTKVILVASKKFTGERGLVLLSSQEGDYSVIKDEEFVLEKSDKLDIFCPVCQKNLDSEVNGLAKVLMYSEEDYEHVYFAKDFGDHATIVISAGEISRTYGSAENYILPGGFSDHELNQVDIDHSQRG